MPPSPPETSRLVKELGKYVGLCDLTPRERRDIGWFDFRAFDYPKTGDAIDVAAQAVTYVSFGPSGAWNRKTAFIVAVFEYLFGETGYEPTPQEELQLRGLLERGESATEAIHDWFRTTFGEDESTE